MTSRPIDQSFWRCLPHSVTLLRGRRQRLKRLLRADREFRGQKILCQPSSDPKTSPLHETGASPDLLLDVGTRQRRTKQRPAGPRNRLINRKVLRLGFTLSGIGDSESMIATNGARSAVNRAGS